MHPCSAKGGGGMYRFQPGQRAQKAEDQGQEREGRSMSRYYAFVSLDMVMPDQVDVLRRSQEGVVGWRYRPNEHILDLLFETDVTTERARLDALAAGQTVYLVLDAQKQVFHLPTKNSVLEEIADEVECLLGDAVGTDENCFNPDEYYVPASHITKLTSLLQKLAEVEE